MHYVMCGTSDNLQAVHNTYHTQTHINIVLDKHNAPCVGVTLYHPVAMCWSNTILPPPLSLLSPFFLAYTMSLFPLSLHRTTYTCITAASLIHIHVVATATHKHCPAHVLDKHSVPTPSVGQTLDHPVIMCWFKRPLSILLVLPLSPSLFPSLHAIKRFLSSPLLSLSLSHSPVIL